jgi:hypothetical protein
MTELGMHGREGQVAGRGTSLWGFAGQKSYPKDSENCWGCLRKIAL